MNDQERIARLEAVAGLAAKLVGQLKQPVPATPANESLQTLQDDLEAALAGLDRGKFEDAQMVYVLQHVTGLYTANMPSIACSGIGLGLVEALDALAGAVEDREATTDLQA